MHRDVESIPYTEDTIRQRVASLGAEISAEYRDTRPILLGILKGSFVFLADLARCLTVDCEVQFISAASYGSGAVSSGEVALSEGVPLDIAGRHVLVVEDILDSGVTLSHLLEYLQSLKPASLKVCVFLDKAAARRAPVTVHYRGFVCPNSFFVGYGLDYAERYRNLPYIGVLRPAVYA
jgi:hypoxanthine phosphoribosyltransferase